MAETLVLFSSDTPGESQICRSLRRAGYTVKRVHTLSALHTIAYSFTVLAVVLNRTIIERYCLEPIKHLKRARSACAIISWHSGLYHPEVDSVSVLCEYSTNGWTQERRIEELDHVVKIIENPEKDEVQGDLFVTDETTRYGKRGLVTETDIPLVKTHKKMRKVYELLVDAGSKGISVEDLSIRLWGRNAQIKRDDLQSYMSKLRKLLTEASGGKRTIARKGETYRISPIHNETAEQ